MSSKQRLVYLCTYNLYDCTYLLVREEYQVKWLCRVKNSIDGYGL